jgi:hypothetical protein
MKRLLLRISLTLLASCALHAADTTFWVAPCLSPREGCIAADEDLARWALAAWESVSGGRLHFVETKDRNKATLRLIWATEEQGLYGETLGTIFDTRRGAEIYVHNTVDGMKDALLRDTVVYLTCLHESGHALGLPHTAEFADIMYSFQFGGDIPEYFGRYRRKLMGRADIRKNSGISASDLKHLMERLER